MQQIVNDEKLKPMEETGKEKKKQILYEYHDAPLRGH
jgi:hypothetical protein